MDLKENIFYWEKSLKKPESSIDNFYVYERVIVNDKDFVKKVKWLRRLIKNYCELIKKNEKNKLTENILDDIYKILISTKNIQYTEFVAFWKTLGISYTGFKEEQNNTTILREILLKYCKRREELYNRLGYSNVSVQALYDAGTSRKQGVSGIQKVISLAKKYFGESISHVKNINDLNDPSREIAYFLPDKGDRDLFYRFCEYYEINYKFGKNNQGKLPDIVIKINERFFVIEAKHIKESGGAQDKQIGELIKFMENSAKSGNILFVSFLDGVYFNNFISAKNKNFDNKGKKDQNNKLKKQISEIEYNLKNNKTSFFVNTAGLEELFNDAVDT